MSGCGAAGAHVCWYLHCGAQCFYVGSYAMGERQLPCREGMPCPLQSVLAAYTCLFAACQVCYRVVMHAVAFFEYTCSFIELIGVMRAKLAFDQDSAVRIMCTRSL